MDRVYQAGVSSVPPAAPFPGATGSAQGHPALPTFTPTSPGAFWFYHVTESMRNVIVAAGLTPDASNLTQFAHAIQILAGRDPGYELREDFSIELREDFSYEARE
jgi:hypothetical protein